MVQFWFRGFEPYKSRKENEDRQIHIEEIKMQIERDNKIERKRGREGEREREPKRNQIQIA